MRVQSCLPTTLAINPDKPTVAVYQPTPLALNSDGTKSSVPLSEVEPQAADNDHPENSVGDNLWNTDLVVSPVRKKNWRAKYEGQNTKSLFVLPLSGHRPKFLNEHVKWLTQHLHVSPRFVSKRSDFLEMLIG